jgi:fatty-acyl-CoA synthase
MFLSYLQQYNQNKSQYDVSCLRTGIMAGALCPEILMNRVMNELNIKDITICYGMTETSPVSFQTHPSDTIQHKTQTVGKILPRLEAKIVD